MLKACVLALGLGSLLASALPTELAVTQPSGSSGHVSKSSGSGTKSPSGTSGNSPTHPNNTPAKPASTSTPAGKNPLGNGAGITVDGKVVPPSCITSDFSKVKSIIAACTTSVIHDMTVPMNGQLTLSGLGGKTIALGGLIEFTASPGGRLPTLPLILFSHNTNCKLMGLPGLILHGHGELYYDGGGGNQGIKKPKFVRIEYSQNSLITNLNIKNAPVHCFAIAGSSKIVLDQITIDSSDGDKPCSQLVRPNKPADFSRGGKCGHNSDGFGISNSQSITIKNAHVYNQDDCLAVNSGSDIVFANNYCSGGHGVSVGSIKTGSKVNGVHISNTTVHNSENGIRVKTYNDATDASVSNVTYSGITLQAISKFGIVIQQDYRNEGPTGKPGNTVPIKGLTLQNVSGNLLSGNAQHLYVLCGQGTCSEWAMSGIQITGGKAVTNSRAVCVGAPGTVTPFCK